MTASLSRRGLIAAASVSLALAAAAPAAAAATRPDPARVTLGQTPAWTAQAASPSLRAASAPGPLHLTAVLALPDPAAAEKAALEVSDPSSSRYRHYYTAKAWRAAFAPSDAAVSAVTTWLSDNGFTLDAVPANHRFVSFRGTAEQVERAFQTQLATLVHDGRTAVAPVTSYSVPASLGATVVGLSGIDTSATKRPLHIGGPDEVRATARPNLVAAPTASPSDVLPPPGTVFKNATPCSAYFGEKPATGLPNPLTNPLTYAPCGYKPAQLRGAYGIDAALKAGYDGRGATVAVVDAYASPTILDDAKTYAARNDSRHPLRSYQFSQSLPATYSYVDECDASGWYGEETLDVEAVHAMAPQSNILYVGGSSCQDQDLNAAVNTVVDNDLAQIVTNSYGDTGEPASVADVAEDHQTFIQAAAQGISMLFSSGDNGDEIDNTGTRQVDYAASDPFITSVGGTSLGVGENNEYLFEQGWGTGKSILTNGTWDPATPAYLYGGGGGTSQLFKQPKYQRGVVPWRIARYFGGAAYRAVPDVAMVGDPNTGFLVGQSQTFPDGRVRYSEYRIGGTSLSSPLLAGVTAVANQVTGVSLGFLNPLLYKLAGSAAFHDVDHGRRVTDGVVRVDYVNGVDSADGLRTSLRTFNQTGTIYTRPGYDDVTGNGTPNGASFLVGLASVAGHR